MATTYLFTVEIDGKKYRYCSASRGKRYVAQTLGISEDKVTSGADSKLPWYGQDKDK